MKKLFTLLAAVLVAGCMMAQTNLFDKSTATFESWFGDGSWAQIYTSTASYDATTGTITCNINQSPFGQWHAQLKLTTSGIVLDATKNYEFKCKFHSNQAANGVTIKVFDSKELFTTVSDFAILANTDSTFTSPAFVGTTDIGNGVIVFDLGNATSGTTVTISDITLQETAAPVVEDPKPTTAPAAPTADAATVASVYSNSYPAASAFGFCESWGQTSSLEELNLDGNTVLYYKNFNYVGWATSTPIDASEYTGLHMDIWAPQAGTIKVTPIYGGNGGTSDDTKGKQVSLNEGWNSFDWTLATDFAGLNLNSIFQFKFSDGDISQFAVDNVYFSGRTSTVDYSTLAQTYNKAANDSVVLKDFDVTYVNGSYCYIKDATASGLLFYKNYGLKAGDHVTKGLHGTISVYNGLYEIVPTTAYADLTITAGTAPEPEVAAAADKTGDNRYVIYKNVTMLADSMGLATTASKTFTGRFGNDTITFYNQFKLAAQTFETGKTYDVVGCNSYYKKPQVSVVSITEHEQMVDPCADDHGLFNVATAAINGTYFGPGWSEAAGSDYSASIENGNIVLHIGATGPGEMWNAQLFVDPGMVFNTDSMYHYEFDVQSAGKVCMTIAVNDDDANRFFVGTAYDKNIGGGTFHFSTDSVIPNANLKAGRGPLVFGFGWTEANQDIIISCVKISAVGAAPAPVEKHMYIKHPWGTGADADWTWKEMADTTFKNFDAYHYVGAWGGVGFNIADNAEGNDADWYAADKIQFLDPDGVVTTAPAVGTAACDFVYVPGFKGGAVTPAYVLVPSSTGLDEINAEGEAMKFMQNGKLFIRRAGHIFNANGQIIK